jgi:hypothetical protein
MPPQLEARRSERIDYKADVELLARTGASAVPNGMLARALDLGAGGMRLETRAHMPVGAEVMCRFTLDGRPAALPGRVAWNHEPHADEAANAHAMGVCFESLGAYETGLLRQVVERSNAGYRPVELHFAGIAQPVIARARAHGDGLRLSAALPIFARGAELSFQLDEEGPHFTGRIGDATLSEEDGVRRIEIDIDVAGDAFGEADKRDRRRARYGYAAEIQAQERSDVAAPSAEDTVHSTQRVTARRSSARAERSPALPMFVAAVVGGTLAWTAASRWTPAPEAPQAEFVARPLPAAAAPAALAPVAPAPAPSSAAAAVPTLVVSEEDIAAAQPAAQPLPQADAPPKLVAPESSVDANATRVRLPFEGSLVDMRATVWAEPAALAIDLPHGATSLEPGRYAIDAGGVTDLRVNKNARSLLLRIRLAAPISRYAIALEDGVLEAQLQRPRASRAAH